jgi:GTP-binding protein
LTGRGVGNVVPALDRVGERHRLRVPTSELNREVRRIVGRHQAPAERGRPWRFFYATQVAGAPPTFLLFANRRLKRGHNYRKYLENSIRQTFGLDGVPLRIVVRERRGDADANRESSRFV